MALETLKTTEYGSSLNVDDTYLTFEIRKTPNFGVDPEIFRFVKMAGVTGLEPATTCVTGRYSNQLSYTPNSLVNEDGQHTIFV